MIFLKTLDMASLISEVQTMLSVMVEMHQC